MTMTFLGDSRAPLPVTSALPKRVRSHEVVVVSQVQVAGYTLGNGTVKLVIGRPVAFCVALRYVNIGGAGVGVPPSAKSAGATAKRLCGACRSGSRNIAVPALVSFTSLTGAVSMLATDRKSVPQVQKGH